MNATFSLRRTMQPGRLLRFKKAFATGLLCFSVWLGCSLNGFAQYNPPTSGLVGWWRGEGNGNDSVDSHNGVVGSGVNFVPGVYGQSFDFTLAGDINGTSRVDVPDSDAFKLTNSLTIAAWVNADPQTWAILQRGDSRSGLDPYTFGYSPGGPLTFQVTGSATSTITIDATPLPYHQWIQVTATLDGATGDMRIYANGAVVAEAVTSVRPFGDLIPGDLPGLTIGNASGGYNFPFYGQIDEVLLYSRALSPTEVASLVPEPSSLALLLVGGTTTMLIRRRR